jgi:hypothetical protein
MENVWVFNGANSAFPSAVFDNKEDALRWIGDGRLTGTLTCYPVGISVYDWVIKEGKWCPKEPRHSSPDYIAKFSSAHLEHFHFEDGE